MSKFIVRGWATEEASAIIIHNPAELESKPCGIPVSIPNTGTVTFSKKWSKKGLQNSFNPQYGYGNEAKVQRRISANPVSIPNTGTVT